MQDNHGHLLILLAEKVRMAPALKSLYEKCGLIPAVTGAAFCRVERNVEHESPVGDGVVERPVFRQTRNWRAKLAVSVHRYALF